MNMKLLLRRKYKKDKYTIGKLYYLDNDNNEVYICDTIEDKDRNLYNDMGLYEINKKKVYGETAIPRGTYNIELTYSPKFAKRKWALKYKSKVPQIMNVPCWEGVRLHPANYASELLGCIAPGYNKVKGGVINSTECFYKIMDEYIIPAYNKKEHITITIVG